MSRSTTGGTRSNYQERAWAQKSSRGLGKKPPRQTLSKLVHLADTRRTRREARPPNFTEIYQRCLRPKPPPPPPPPGRGPRSKPPGRRSVLGRASLTFRSRPPRSFPF